MNEHTLQNPSAIITVIRDEQHPLGKQFTLNPDGSVSKSSAVAVSVGIAVMHQVDTHEEFASLMKKVGDDPHAAIINASFEGIPIGEEFLILSEREIEKRLGIPRSDRNLQKGVHQVTHNGKQYKAIGRFKENVRPSCWQFFDRDVDQHTPQQFASMNFEESKDSLEKIVPSLKDVSFCRIGSISSRVLHNGKAVGGGNGHLWLKFREPTDIERFRAAIMVEAAKHEMTWLKPRHSRSNPSKIVGHSLTTIIDPSVFTPGRLVFYGKPVTSEGLVVEELSANIQLGSSDTFDNTSLVLADAESIRKISRKAGIELSISAIGSSLRVTMSDLTLETEIETEDSGVLTVRQILEKGASGKIRCQTPFRNSNSFAAFLGIGSDGKPFVHDVGTNITHWLQDKDHTELQTIKAKNVVVKLMPKVKADCGAPFEPDAIEALKIIKTNCPADFQRYRAEIKNANNSVSLVNLDRLLKAQAGNGVAPAQTHHGYADALLAKLTVDKYRPVGHAGELYVVDPDQNIWVRYPFEKLTTFVAETHDGNSHCERSSDYRAIAQHTVSLATDEKFFEGAPVGLACPDGFYRIVGNEIKVERLTPAHRQRVKISVTPVEMPTPLFEAFLYETFKSSNQGEEEQQISLLQEIAGTTMLGIAYKFQKAVLFYDPFGRAGKGTTERIMRETVPSTFISAVSPFYWHREYFLASLAGSRLNVVGELPDDKPIPAAAFKTVTGGDMLTGRHPTHRPISFKNEASHLFMSNHLINTTDHSEAFFARWLIIEFPNSRIVNGLPIDPHLPDRIIQAELAGIAHWALVGAARLMQNGAFSRSVAHDRLMTQWRCRTNSLDEFIFECCELGGHDYVFKRASLYRVYTQWCAESGRKPFAKAKVKDLITHNASLRIVLSSLDGYEVFRGIKLKNEYADEFSVIPDSRSTSTPR